MDKVKFRHHLEEVTEHLIDFTKTLCYNNFSDNYKYIITPNSRIVAKDDEHLNEKEIFVLKTWKKFEGQLLTATEAGRYTNRLKLSRISRYLGCADL